MKQLLQNMRCCHALGRGLAAIWLLAGSLISPLAAQAAPSGQAVQSLAQQDSDGDGKPDLTIIKTSFASSADEIRVYDGAGDMQASQDWRQATDFENDTWVFDRGGDGSAQLVLRFERAGESVIATLFSDQNKDGKIALAVAGHQVTVEEAGFAPLRVTVQGSWWLPNGQLNWNVRFQTDGPLLHLHNGHNVADFWLRNGNFKMDGSPDAELVFADQDRDGIPEYGIWRVLAGTAETDGAPRTLIWSNEGRHQPVVPAGFVFWPYLRLETPSTVAPGQGNLPQDQKYFDTTPSITYNFNAATTNVLAFQGYPIEQGFHVNTLRAFQPGERNYADFENAMAYYDLAGDTDGAPELHIRHRYYEAGDLYNGNLATTTNEIRYSWNQTNSSGFSWDYKLGLAGRNTITSTVHVGDFAYGGIPYVEMPTWAAHTKWDYASFVAREGANFLSSEGIYAWAPVENLVDDDPMVLSRYLAGETNADIRAGFQSLSPGWRGDFTPNLQAQPYLYFSSIDHKLHLLKANQGVWQIDDTTQIRYRNLDGDPYLDQWMYTHASVGAQTVTETRQLNIAGSHILYADDSSVAIRQTQVRSSIFEVLPPTNHAEWQALGSTIEAAKSNIEPTDFRAMLEQFAGSELRITGATLRDYRPVGTNGFRFVLDLQPGFTVNGDQLIDLATLRPGSYAVRYDGAFHVEPLSLPILALHAPANGLAAEPAVALRTGQLHLQLSSDAASADAPTVAVRAEALAPDGQAQPIGEQQVAVLAGETTPLTFEWAPPAAGDWQIRVTAITTPTLDAPPMTAHFKAALLVAPAALPSPAESASAFGLVPLPALAGLLLAALLAAGLLGRYLLLPAAARRKL